MKRIFRATTNDRQPQVTIEILLDQPYEWKGRQFRGLHLLGAAAADVPGADTINARLQKAARHAHDDPNSRRRLIGVAKLLAKGIVRDFDVKLTIWENIDQPEEIEGEVAAPAQTTADQGSKPRPHYYSLIMDPDAEVPRLLGTFYAPDKECAAKISRAMVRSLQAATKTLPTKDRVVKGRCKLRHAH